MFTSTREEILLVLKGSFSDAFDDTFGKWTNPFTAAKFQIIQSENDFMLRISTDSQTFSDPLVFTSIRNVSSIKKLSETLLQVNLRADRAPNVKFCLQFGLPRDQDHFFLILKNATEELASRDFHDRDMEPRRPALRLPPPPKPTEPAKVTQMDKPIAGQHYQLPRLRVAASTVSLRAPMATKASTLPLVGQGSGLEAPARGVEIDSLMNALQRYIASGDCSGASEAAMGLAKKKTKLSISADEIGDIPGIRSKFSLDVCVEDRQSSGAKITLFDVIPNMTISYLKKMVFQQYKFPVEVQIWIIGRRIIKDAETLMECRINSSTPVFLYLITAEKAGITREEVEIRRNAMMAQQMQFMRAMPAMVPANVQPQAKSAAPIPGPRKPSRRAPRDMPHRDMSHRDMSHMPSIIFVPPAAPSKPTSEDVGWHCPRCTLINPPTVPGCRACMTERPEDYEIPDRDSYTMDPEEKVKQDELHRNERLMEESFIGLQEPDQTGLCSLDDDILPEENLTFNEFDD